MLFDGLADPETILPTMSAELFPPWAATTDLTFWSTPELSHPVRIPAGTEVATAAIGPAGENRVRLSAVFHIGDDKGVNARCGMGAVMGAKGLKAIVVDDAGTPAVSMADKEGYGEILSNWIKLVKEDKQLQGFSMYGTPAGIVALRGLGSMPSKNYSSEETPGFENR